MACTVVRDETSPAIPLFPVLVNICTDELAMCAGISNHLHDKRPEPFGLLLQSDRHNGQMIGYVLGNVFTSCLYAQFV
jgi:hypothetical protein